MLLQHCLALTFIAFVYTKASWSAVIVDSRFDAVVLASISNARHHIPIEVKIIYKTDKKHWRDAHEATIGMPNFHISTGSYENNSVWAYNELFMSTAFWLSFTTDYILVFQRDSRFCSYSHHRIEDFVGMFDYIGAPWRLGGFYDVLVGNGGFSLRSKKAMLFCTQHNDFMRLENEDIAFAVCVASNNFTLASVAQAAEFSVETVRLSNSTPLAIHKSWVYLPEDRFLARHCPESIPIQKRK